MAQDPRHLAVNRETLESILLDVKQGTPGYARTKLEKLLADTPKHEAPDAMGMESQRDKSPTPLSGKSGELKPCPFCSAPAKAIERSNPMSKWRWSVDCASTTCGMSGPVEDSKQRAVEAWNRRATTQPAEQSASSPVEGEGLREQLEYARDLLMERKHGSPARSPAHSARLVIEDALKSITTRSVAVSSEAVAALEPFALLVGYGDPANATVNMDDPISKWLTVAQLQDAARVMNDLLNQARKPEGGVDA